MDSLWLSSKVRINLALLFVCFVIWNIYWAVLEMLMGPYFIWLRLCVVLCHVRLMINRSICICFDISAHLLCIINKYLAVISIAQKCIIYHNLTLFIVLLRHKIYSIIKTLFIVIFIAYMCRDKTNLAKKSPSL